MKQPFVSNHQLGNQRIRSSDASSSSDVTGIRNCNNGDDDEQPSDCEARYAMEYGFERKFIRSAEHAYLFQEKDELMMLAPASNSRIVPKKYSGLEDDDFSIA